MYISYSGFKKYSQCPYSYWHSYVNQTKLGPEDRLGSIYGTVVGKLFEDFYMQRLWKAEDPVEALLQRVEATTDMVLREETSPDVRRGKPAGFLLWRDPANPKTKNALYENREELLTDVRDAVRRGIRIIKAFRLLGPVSIAEFKLDLDIPAGHRLAGRADFVIQRADPHNDLIILDGKGSRHRGTYVDPKQVQWYALLYWLGKKVVPNKLGFVYWRYEPPESLDWVEFSEANLNELLEETLSAIAAIESSEKIAPAGVKLEMAREAFKPQPSDQSCKFCPYMSSCPQGTAFMEDKKKSKKGK